MVLAAFVETQGRGVLTAASLWNKDMKHIAVDTLSRAIEYEAEHGEDAFGPVNRVQNPRVADGIKLGNQKVYGKNDKAGQYDATATQKANATQFRMLEERVSGKSVSQRQTCIVSAETAHWKEFRLPDDTVKDAEFQGVLPEAYGAVALRDQLVSTGVLSNEDPAYGELKTLVTRAIYGIYTIAYADSSEVNWTLQRSALKKGNAEMRLKTDPYAFKYKKLKTGPRVLSASQPQPPDASIRRQSPAAAARGKPDMVSPGASSADAKLKWAAKQREQKEGARACATVVYA